MSRFSLQVHIHSDRTDPEAAFLVESHRFVILRVYFEGKAIASEYPGQCPHIRNHGFSNTMAPKRFINADAVNLQVSAGHNSIAAFFENPENDIAGNRTLQLCHIDKSLPDIFQKGFFRIRSCGSVPAAPCRQAVCGYGGAWNFQGSYFH